MTTTKLTKIQLSALRDFEDGQPKTGYELAIGGATISKLFDKGFIKTHKWSKTGWKDHEMVISKEGLQFLREQDGEV